MISTYTQNKITWVDLENPTKEEVRTLMEKYDLSPEVAEDLLDPTVRTRADIYEDFIYFVLHFPLHNHKKHHAFDKRTEEVDFIIGKNFLITVHYSPIQTFASFAKAIETDSLLHYDTITQNSGILFVHILSKMYTAVQDKIDDMKTTLTTYEESIFSGKEKEMVFELSALNRVLIYFKESLSTHNDIFKIFESNSIKLFGKEFQKYNEHLTREYNKSLYSVDATKAYADELRETNDSLLSTKQNEIMKTLTVVNFIILPLTLLAGVFGMNTENTPIAGHPYDFWILALFMTFLGLIAFLIFKRKKWL